jgi:hypothetical protein
VARLQAWGVSGHGCVEPVVRWASFPACVGFEVGAMHGRGAQISESRRDRLPWAAVALDGAVAFTPIRRLAIVVGVGIHVPVVRPRFSIDGLGRVHEPAPVTGSVRGGLEFRFP